MKKIKLFLFVALFGAMTLGAYSAYDYLTLSADEKALLANVEALTSGESGSNPSCYSSCYDRIYEYCQVTFISSNNEVVVVGCPQMDYL